MITKKELTEKMVNNKILLPNQGITSIEGFPEDVKEIYLDGNNLCHLPKVPEGVEVLILRGNPLIEEPNIPDSVKYADLTDTCLEDEIYFDVRKTIIEAISNVYNITANYEEPDEDDEDDIVDLYDITGEE